MNMIYVIDFCKNMHTHKLQGGRESSYTVYLASPDITAFRFVKF